MKINNIILIFLLFIAIQTNAQDAKKYTTYVVKSSETLRSIAKKVGCRYKVIKNLNPDVDKKHLPLNTTLVIPNKNYGKPVIKDTVPVKKEIYHVVEAGHTFYSIAKKYNVPINAIRDANPITAEGLKPGMRLRIPSQDEFTVKPKSNKLVLYKIKKGDTRWNISAKNNMTVAELERINLGLKNGFKIGDNIWIPAKEETLNNENNAKVDDSLFIYHIVKKGEGLFRIAVLYDTTQERIIEMNPEATKKLRTGMLLKIPAKKKNKFLIHKVIKGDNIFNITRKYEVSESDLLALNPALNEGVKIGMLLKIKLIHDITIPLNENLLVDSITVSKPIHVSFLMPLKADGKIDYSKKSSKLQNICTDFYMGAEIAIDSLRRQGLVVNSHVYDTKNDPSVIYNLLQNEDLKESDLIIGPFFIGNAKRVANELPDIPVFTPSNKLTTNSTRNLIKASVSQTEITNSLVKYLKEKYLKEKIIIIPDTNVVNHAEANRIKRLLLAHDSIFDVTIITPSRNKKNPDQVYMNKEKLQESIEEKKDTWVLLISDLKVISSDVVNTFGVMANEHAIKLFTTKIFEDFKHLDYQLLGQLSWSFPSTQFIDLNNQSVTSFKKKYYNLNHAQPSKYSFTGFDMTYDSLMRLAQGNNYSEGLEAGKSIRLSHQFDYINSNKGFDNKGVLLISFNKDLEYQLLK